jgi:uncharacterized protein (DUF983 family)
MKEPNDELGLSMPTGRRALVTIGRALRGRCPNCGRGPVRETWWRMRATCGNCGIQIERGESDYFMGSMMFNLVLSELLFALLLVGAMVAYAPDVPWDVIQWVAPLGIALTPLLMFPVSKLVWLGFDLLFRPSGGPPDAPGDREGHPSG